ncbi:flagellar hook-associated protein FlgL [Clostridium saccharobutylicum]|uniref:Flagellar hook-associated protein 3 n=1 Tax=Clostridium saccharobutylicum TaxID=169679 RepID=A0A1S8NIN2_CLOSA|nr:flagellar hook-associated protein FlgL [Clostridium saccharobutylicum]OOM16278.1 flagellar hook-associated protein 3 [Clostridium saccharobutylicum]
MARITNSMMSSNYLSNMNRNLGNMQTLQKQLSSGKQISRPSDNPYITSRAIGLYSEIDSNKQYNENIKDISNWLDTTDTALGQAGDIFNRIRELQVSAGNGAYGNDERTAIQDEIKQKVGELTQVLNTNFDGAYIFGGTKSASKPVMVDSSGNICCADKTGAKTTDSTIIKQIGSDLNVEVSQGVLINYNKTAIDVLQYKDKSGTKQNVNDVLQKIIKNLEPNSYSSTTAGACITETDNIITNLLQKRAEVGAMSNRMESAQSQNEEENLNMTNILSKTEDIDFTEKTMEYSVMQTVYMAALQTGAKVLPKTILDYL